MAARSLARRRVSERGSVRRRATRRAPRRRVFASPPPPTAAPTSSTAWPSRSRASRTPGPSAPAPMQVGLASSARAAASAFASGGGPPRRSTSAAPTSSRSRSPTSSIALPSCSRLRVEARHYFPTGRSAEPFALVGGGRRRLRKRVGRGDMGAIGHAWRRCRAGALRGLALVLVPGLPPGLPARFVDTDRHHARRGLRPLLPLEIALEAQDTF